MKSFPARPVEMLSCRLEGWSPPHMLGGVEYYSTVARIWSQGPSIVWSAWGFSGLAPEWFLRELSGQSDAGLPIRSGPRGGKRFIHRCDIGFLV